MKFLEITACSKLQVPKTKYGYQVKARAQFLNMPNGIFRTLNKKYSEYSEY